MHQLIEVIRGAVGDALNEMGDEDPNATSANFTTPRHANQGDVALPCFALAKTMKKAPQEIASTLAEKLAPVLTNMDGCDAVSYEGGFCNFFVDVEWLAGITIQNTLNNPESVGHFRESSSLLIEHTSANPNGPFHVGRSRNAILGDTFVRMHRLAGDDVRAEYYVDDMGKQVGILAWALDNLDEARVSDILTAAEMGEESNYPDKQDHQRVRFYQAANLLKLENPTVESGVTELVQASEEADAETLDKFEAAYQPVLDGMLQTLARLGIEFDSFTKESQFIIDGSVDVIMAKLETSELHGIAENGAHFLELESRGVQGKSTKFYFRRGDGSSLYATRDIAYHQWKWNEAKRLLNILGEDHKLQSKQVGIALDELDIQNPEVVFYAFTKLPDGKMSTRRGNVVYMDDLLDEAAERATQVVKEIREDLSEDELNAIGEAVGMSAVRFNIIRVSPEKGINFRWEDALSFEADSAPFIMYSHARACSISRRLKAAGHDVDALVAEVQDWSGLSDSAAALVKRIATFAEALNYSIVGQRPNLFSSYLLALATEYNRFYHENHVMEEAGINSRNLALSEAARELIAAGCEGLGIIAVESM
ncbi:MAG: arginine--tRNA ligase [Candidatus Thalassarchaeaceae archaeon]|nr:arginine--tRNA ligase [Candidatus Thalassarchaeaceae archaeon]MDP7042419.1 arginine--tRNA ligase [Candidatus Thalassarchaeaceae archaeon]